MIYLNLSDLLIIITTTYFTDNFCPCYNLEGKGLLTMNLSILNILSYGDLNLFLDAKILRIREIMTIQIINPQILEIVMKLDQLIPQFNFTIKF